MLESHSWLELRGWSDEPLREVYQFTVHLHVDERTEPWPVVPPAIGSILRVSPVVDAVIGMPGVEFNRVWTLAAAGQLHHCWLAFTEPQRGLHGVRPEVPWFKRSRCLPRQPIRTPRVRTPPPARSDPAVERRGRVLGSTRAERLRLC
jgi:hypothetical protein